MEEAASGMGHSYHYIGESKSGTHTRRPAFDCDSNLLFTPFAGRN